MMWIGLIGGIVLGAAMGGVAGAIALGFIGWLGGLIVGSMTKSAGKAISVAAAPDTPADTMADEPMPGTLEERVARLEDSLARVHERLAKLDPTFVTPDAASAAMVRGPIGSRTVVAIATSGRTVSRAPRPFCHQSRFAMLGMPFRHAGFRAISGAS